LQHHFNLHIFILDTPQGGRPTERRRTLTIAFNVISSPLPNDWVLKASFSGRCGAHLLH
jgi:hypothetical protein